MNQQKLSELVISLRKPIAARRQIMYQLFKKGTLGALRDLLKRIEIEWDYAGEDAVIHMTASELTRILSTFGTAEKTNVIFEDIDNLTEIKQALTRINMIANSGAFRDDGSLAAKTSELIAALNKDIEALQKWRHSVRT